PALWDVKSAYETVSLALEGAVTLSLPTNPMFVYGTGGAQQVGDAPSQDAAFLGGNNTARYMEAQRYAGDAMMYGSVEFRIPVMRGAFVLPFDGGIVG